MIQSTVLALQAGGGIGPLAVIIQIVFIVAIFYVLLILPQRREQKRHRELLAALNRGDEVVTVGGLIGEIINFKDDQVMLKSGDARVIVERARIARLATPPAKAAK